MDTTAQRVALVTGASQGLGRALAEELAGGGWTLIIDARRADRLEAAATELASHTTVVAIPGDIADSAHRARLVDAVHEFGRLDLLVNNASSFFPVEVGAIEASHFEELIGSNLRAPLFISQEAAPHLAEARGAIVNIVDIHAERPLKGYSVYSVAKSGLAALTRSLALELAPEVRVNGVAPGAIAWPEDGQLGAEERQRILKTTPLGRLGAPEDIAQAVHFLACAPYVTGQILAVDGGRSIFL